MTNMTPTPPHVNYDDGDIRALYDAGAHFILCNGAIVPDNPKAPWTGGRNGWTGGAEHAERLTVTDVMQHVMRGGLIGVVPWSLGMVVVDVDSGGEDAMEAAIAMIGVEPVIAHMSSTDVKWHIWFRADEPLPNGTWAPEAGAPKVGDIRGGGGFVVLWEPAELAAALHRREASGVADIGRLPAAAGRTRRRRELSSVRAPRTDPADEMRATREGDRNNTLYRLAFRYPDRADDLLEAAVAAGLPRSGAEGTVASAVGGRAEADGRLAAAAADGLLDVQQQRFADLFRAFHGATVRFVPQRGEWLQFVPGGGWLPAPIRNLMADAIRETCNAVGGVEEVRLKMRNANMRRNVVDGAIAFAEETMAEKEWDSDPDLLGHPNGMCTDLSTGGTRPMTAEDLISRATAVTPAGSGDGAAEFVGDMLGSAERTARYRWRMRRALRGRPQHLMLVIEGPEGSGKSTIVGSLQMAMGGYGMVSGSDNLMQGSGRKHKQWKARMWGARLIMTHETEGGDVFNAGGVSEMLGGTRLEANFMRRNSFEFMPQFDIVHCCNTRPELPRDRAGMNRRLEIITFPTAIGEGRRDSVQEYWHSEEGQAVMLRWVLDCPLEEPPRDEDDAEATADYTAGARDNVADWMRAAVERAEGRVLPAAAAYGAYTEALGMEDTPATEGTFRARMDALLGTRRAQGWDSNAGERMRGWRGFRLCHSV